MFFSQNRAQFCGTRSESQTIVTSRQTVYEVNPLKLSLPEKPHKLIGTSLK